MGITADDSIRALRELSQEALNRADSFTAADFASAMHALAENFVALDAAMLCNECKCTGLERNTVAVHEVAGTVRICTAEHGWGRVTKIKRSHDGIDLHFVQWEERLQRDGWHEVTPNDTIENFVALCAAWKGYQ